MIKKKFIIKKILKNKKIWHSIKIFLFRYTINMSNPQQNKIHSEIEQFKREINLMQDKLKQSKRKKKVYCKMDKSESQK